MYFHRSVRQFRKPGRTINSPISQWKLAYPVILSGTRYQMNRVHRKFRKVVTDETVHAGVICIYVTQNSTGSEFRD